MNNYQKKARTKVLQDVTIKCSECKTNMIQVTDLYDSTIVGYSCVNCSRSFVYDLTDTWDD